MKKILTVLFLLSFLCFGAEKAQALSFEDAIKQKKPCAVLIYATWADNKDAILSIFDSMGQPYADKYNFVRINIAQEEAKDFNKTHYIYPKVPYVLLFKNNGRMSRCVSQDCIMNNSCLKEKMDLFAD